MNKDTFRGIICGFLLCVILLTGTPVSADTGGNTLSDKLITAITGNNVNSRLDTMNMNITSLTTAVNNSGGTNNNFGTFGGHTVVAGGAVSNSYLSYTGSGIARIVWSNNTYLPSSCLVIVDGIQVGYLDTYAVWGYGYGYSYSSGTTANNVRIDNSSCIYEVPFKQSLELRYNINTNTNGVYCHYVIIK